MCVYHRLTEQPHDDIKHYNIFKAVLRTRVLFLTGSGDLENHGSGSSTEKGAHSKTFFL